MNTESPLRGQNVSGLDLCIDRIRFAQATELARAGRYLEAEALLAPKGQIPESHRDLDLLARIAILQKQFSRAERFWQAALQKSPGNEVYAHCLEQIRNLDPKTDFGHEEQDSNLISMVLIYVSWVVSFLGFAAIVWAFWPRK